MERVLLYQCLALLASWFLIYDIL